MFAKAIYVGRLWSYRRAVDLRLSALTSDPYVGLELVDSLRDAVAHGRRFRAVLVLLTHTWFGGTWRNVVDLGCAIELLHKASLIHDDIVDKDDQRRGRPALWKICGEREALILADFLIALAFRTACEWEKANERDRVVVDILSRALMDAASGEILDIRAEAVTHCSVEELDRIARLKSGRLISASMEVGTASAGEPSRVCDAMSEVGEAIGILFQLINDVNGVDAKAKGRWAADLRNGKKTFATKFLGDQSITFDDFVAMSAKERDDALTPMRNIISMYVDKAKKLLENTPPGAVRDLMTGILETATDEWFWVDSDAATTDVAMR